MWLGGVTSRLQLRARTLAALASRVL